MNVTLFNVELSIIKLDRLIKKRYLFSNVYSFFKHFFKHSIKKIFVLILKNNKIHYLLNPLQGKLPGLVVNIVDSQSEP